MEKARKLALTVTLLLSVGAQAKHVEDKTLKRISESFSYVKTGKEKLATEVHSAKEVFPDIDAFTAELLENNPDLNQKVLATGNTKFIDDVKQQKKQTSSESLVSFVKLEPTGWLLLSNDDVATPIIGYSHDGNLDLDNLPIQLKEIIALYRLQIKHQLYVHGPDNKADWIQAKWNKYDKDVALLKSENASILKPKAGSLRSSTTIGPLVTAQWNQGLYYNAYCPVIPVGGADGHASVGCVAVAMAQIMHYHQWPSTGVGSTYYTYTTDIFYNTHYLTNAILEHHDTVSFNWPNMPNSLTTYNNDVAQILYHAGVGALTRYGNQSSSTLPNAMHALQDHFKYLTDGYHKKSDWSDFGWKIKMILELQAGRPILYAGCGTGCHAFVVDGHNTDDGYHINWGWGGGANDYFLLESLTPNSDFTVSQEAIFGIRPNI